MARFALTRSPRRRWGALGLFLLACVGTYFVTQPLFDPWEITRIRNSMIGWAGTAEDFNWTPPEWPADFRRASGDVPPEFASAATRLRQELIGASGEWALGLAVARHLAAGSGPGPAIQGTTREAYDAILNKSMGYCADYTQVYNGLAHALQLPVREWGISFNSYGGNGHGFSEVWDAALGKWVFVDTFSAFYVVDAVTRVPLSAIEFRDALATGKPEAVAEVVPVSEDRFFFKSKSDAFAFYAPGADQFYLWMANDVFNYDAYPLVDSLGRMSRAVEQMWAIVNGVHPTFRALTTPNSAPHLERLEAAAPRFFGGSVVVVILMVLALVALLERRATTAKV